MPKTIISPWEPEKLTHPLFDPVRPYVADFLGRSGWPSVAEMDAHWFGSREIASLNGAPISLVAQDDKPAQFEDHYAPRIYLKGEIQTREQNWHDFFQAATWAAFPKTKVAINVLHYPAAKYRFDNQLPKGKRSQLENALSQFDECGVILYSSDTSLLEMVRDFDWHSLFWQSRKALRQRFGCMVYGHAIYEKAIHPYIGLTAKAILLPVDADMFALPLEEHLPAIDDRLAEYFGNPPRLTSPRDLQPFPILGMPGYLPETDDEAFYHNLSYFRPGRESD